MGKTVKFKISPSSLSSTSATSSSNLSRTKFCSAVSAKRKDYYIWNNNNNNSYKFVNKMFNTNNKYTHLKETTNKLATTKEENEDEEEEEEEDENVSKSNKDVTEMEDTTSSSSETAQSSIYPSVITSKVSISADHHPHSDRHDDTDKILICNDNNDVPENHNNNSNNNNESDHTIGGRRMGENAATASGSRNNFLSSSDEHTIYDSMTEVIIDDLTETEPTSAILDYCKRKFLRWYLNLLGLAGLYPTSADTSHIQIGLSYLQTAIILTIVCFGYYIQYASSFRRDRGFSVNNSLIMTTIITNPYYRDALDFGEIFFVHVVPSGLHLFGFLFSIYVFRVADNEQLQNLVERVFLLSNRPKRLCTVLWLNVIVFSFILLSLFTAYVVLLVYARPENLQLDIFVIPDANLHYTLKVALIVTTFVQDAIQMTVLTAYCIECYLLRLHLRNLKEKLIQHTIETIDWMREVLEFRKLLNHLNKKVTLPICFFTVMNLSYAFAGLIYVFKEYDFNCPIKIFLLNLGNILLWLIIGILPFFQAATVTRSCQSTQSCGHQIRARPFVYHTTPANDLDSTLLFTSSLNMSAKLFRMPIQINYLCFSILIISICIITLGMCLNISLGIV